MLHCPCGVHYLFSGKLEIIRLRLCIFPAIIHYAGVLQVSKLVLTSFNLEMGMGGQVSQWMEHVRRLKLQEQAERGQEGCVCDAEPAAEWGTRKNRQLFQLNSYVVDELSSVATVNKNHFENFFKGFSRVKRRDCGGCMCFWHYVAVESESNVFLHSWREWWLVPCLRGRHVSTCR